MDSGINTQQERDAMPPDHIDALGPLIENALPEVRSLFGELRQTRLEMREGFREIASTCREQTTTCSAANKELCKRLNLVERENEISKVKTGIIIGGSGATGGILYALAEKIYDLLNR